MQVQTTSEGGAREGSALTGSPYSRRVEVELWEGSRSRGGKYVLQALHYNALVKGCQICIGPAHRLYWRGSTERMSVIFVFVDGVGLAPATPDNPLADAPTPALRALLGGPLTSEQIRTGPFLIHEGHEGHEDREERRPSERRAAVPDEAPSSVAAHIDQAAFVSFVDRSLLLHAIDATLGVPGLPQSGTGQTALFAGFNAAQAYGRHQPHFPPTALRERLAEQSIFRRVAQAGGRAAFANVFGPGYWEALAARRIRRSASVIAAEGAPVRFRDGDDLLHGRAVAWDITGHSMQARGLDAPLVTPQHAGAVLARLAEEHELVFFETFLPDLAGHGRLTLGQEAFSSSPLLLFSSSTKGQVHTAMARIDGLLAGVLATMRSSDTLVLTSDHGNVESLAARAHTTNPVPLLVVGPGTSDFAAVTDISQVADAMLSVLGWSAR
jgi:2,3-bisphosphoglycerate-independent phosphoglycerate mutase